MFGVHRGVKSLTDCAAGFGLWKVNMSGIVFDRRMGWDCVDVDSRVQTGFEEVFETGRTTNFDRN